MKIGKVSAERSSREAATAIVLDDCKEALDDLGLGTRARSQLHALLFELVEDVIEAVRVGEAEDREGAIDAAVEVKEREHDAVIAKLEAEVRKLDQADEHGVERSTLARIRRLIEEAAA